MFRSNPVLWPKPPVIWSLGIAVLSVATALILTQLPALRLEAAPVSLFLFAVIIVHGSAECAGLLATALSALAFYYYFLPPMHSLTAKPEGMPRFIVLAFSLLFAGLLSAAQRRATESLRRARDDLIGTVQQLQGTNEALQAESSERKRAEEKLQQRRSLFIGSTATKAPPAASAGGFLLAKPSGQRNLSNLPYDRATKPTVELVLQRVHPEDAGPRETDPRARRRRMGRILIMNIAW